MPAPSPALTALQKQIWAGTLPLEIRLASSDCRTYDEADPYLIRVPRLSYLPFLLPRLHSFFANAIIDPAIAVTEAWFSFQDVPLKWHYPVGLLFDLFSGAEPATSDDASSAGTGSGKIRKLEGAEKGDAQADTNGEEKILPWRLVLHYSAFPFESLFPVDAEGKVLLDAFINSVKEADFIRNGSAKTVMGLSKNDSSSLWTAVETHNLDLFNSVNNKLLYPPGQSIRHIPIKVYLPTTAEPISKSTEAEDASSSDLPKPGSVRVVQSLVAPTSASRQEVVTLGMALNEMLPSVFPSRRNPVLATPVLHGAIIPMSAPMDELGRVASYADGFLHVVVVVLG